MRLEIEKLLKIKYLISNKMANLRNRNRARVSNLLTETNKLFPIFHRGEGVKSSFKLTGSQIVKKNCKKYIRSLSLCCTRNTFHLFSDTTNELNGSFPQ